jgi:hypothetical protein
MLFGAQKSESMIILSIQIHNSPSIDYILDRGERAGP